MAFKRKRTFASRNAPSYKRVTKRRVFRKRRSGMARMVRNVALKNCELKHKEVHSENINLFHNGGSGPNYNQISELLTNISQGDQLQNREGDEVFVTSLRMKLWLSNKQDRPNVMYRVIIFSNISGATTDLFSGPGNKIVAMFNTEKYSIQYDRTFTVTGGDHSLEPSATLRERSKMVTINMNLKNKRIQWQRASNTLKDLKHVWNLAVIPYDAFGTLTTDNIASFGYTYRLYFRDP